MKQCKLNPDGKDMKCSCLIRTKEGYVCDVYDEDILKLKKCPLMRKKRKK